MTPLEILDLPMDGDNEAGATSVRGYLVALVSTLWSEDASFSAARPFGNSDWRCELYMPLVTAGLVRAHPNGDGWGVVHDDDQQLADELIRDAISAMVLPAGRGELLASARGAQAQADILENRARDLRAEAAALRDIAGGAV